jgi:hypothetical protein
MKDKGWEKGERRRQMDDSVHIHGKLSFGGIWRLNSQLLIKCINCNHKDISQLVS